MPDSPTPFRTPTPADDAFEADVRRLQQVPPAAPAPFLYTRVQARLAAAGKSNALPWWLRRPAYLVAVLVLLVAVNMGAVLHYAYQRPAVATATTSTPLDTFASEYQLTPYVIAYE